MAEDIENLPGLSKADPRPKSHPRKLLCYAPTNSWSQSSDDIHSDPHSHNCRQPCNSRSRPGLFRPISAARASLSAQLLVDREAARIHRRVAPPHIIVIHRMKSNSSRKPARLSLGCARRPVRKPSAKWPISLVTRGRPRVTKQNQESPWEVSDSAGWDSGQAGQAPFRWMRARLARIHVTTDPSDSSHPARLGSSRGDTSSSS